MTIEWESEPCNLLAASATLKGHVRRAVMSHDLVKQEDGTWKPLYVYYAPGDIAFVPFIQKYPEPRGTQTRAGITYSNPYVWGRRPSSAYALGVVIGKIKDVEICAIMLHDNLVGFTPTNLMRKANRSYVDSIDLVPTIYGGGATPVIENLKTIAGL